MKKRIIFLVTLLVFIFVLAINAGADEPKFRLPDGQKTYIKDSIVFLPSNAFLETIEVDFGTYSSAKINGNTVKSGDTINVKEYKTQDANGYVCYVVPFTVDGADYSMTFYRSSLPSVIVETTIKKETLLKSDGSVTDSNTNIVIYNTDGSVVHSEEAASIRVRGNTTQTYAKKPFQIKFPNKVDLFNMGKSKTYILLANYLDQSLLRNSFLYNLALRVGMHASEFQSVDLWIDGEYLGVYLLTEKVQIGKARVNIRELEHENDELNETYGNTRTVTKSQVISDNPALIENKFVKDVVDPEDITGGYLVELDNNNASKASQFKSYFKIRTTTPNGKTNENFYVIKSPENCSQAQVEYIAALFAQAEEAAASETGYNSKGIYYTEYIDVDSYAVAYLMAELGRNYDAGSASMFYHKDVDKGGVVSKIVKGPLWDCDNTFGNILKNNAHVQNDGLWAGGRKPWRLYLQHDDFKLKVKQHLEGMYNTVYDMIDAGGFLDQQVMELGTSVAMERARWDSADSTKWPFYYGGPHYDTWSSVKPTFHSVPVYSDGIDAGVDTTIGYLKTCIETRLDYLCEYYECSVTPRDRTLNSEPVMPGETQDPVYPIVYVEPDPVDPGVDPDPGTETDESTSTDETTSEIVESTSSEAETSTGTDETSEQTQDEQTESESSQNAETEPTSSTSDNTQTDEEEKEQPNWFIRFIRAIINFFINLFGFSDDD